MSPSPVPRPRRRLPRAALAEQHRRAMRAAEAAKHPIPDPPDPQRTEQAQDREGDQR